MKYILKEIKLNESTISMTIGVLIVFVVGILLIKQYRNPIANPTDYGNNLTTQQKNEPETGIQTARMYKVVAGDSLWKIAEREYGTGYEWKEIASANPSIADENSLEVGQELTIPETNKILPEAASTSAPAAVSQAPHQEDHTSSPQALPSTYTVVRGDNLWNIAVRVYGDGHRWTDIAHANNLTNPSIIHSGNVFTLPS